MLSQMRVTQQPGNNDEDEDSTEENCRDPDNLDAKIKHIMHLHHETAKMWDYVKTPDGRTHAGDLNPVGGHVIMAD